MSTIAVIGYTAVGLVVAGWLFVSFGKPGRTRTGVAWAGTSALYVALLSLFTHLLTRALDQDSTLGTVAFGFLVAFFASGLLVSLWRLFGVLRGGGEAGSSATH